MHLALVALERGRAFLLGIRLQENYIMMLLMLDFLLEMISAALSLDGKDRVSVDDSKITRNCPVQVGISF